MAVRMELFMRECSPGVACGCGHLSYGDSVMDALRAWAEHVAAEHRGDW
jgi:hypothetical protein